jgi:hypothetical protein
MEKRQRSTVAYRRDPSLPEDNQHYSARREEIK